MSEMELRTECEYYENGICRLAKQNPKLYVAGKECIMENAPHIQCSKFK